MKNTFINEYETRKALTEFILKAPKLSMDNYCLEFEKQFAKLQGRKCAVLFNSGSSANLSIFQALKNLGTLRDKDKIGFSALTWSTNVMPIIQLGLTPQPIDCDSKCLNITSSNLETSLKKSKLKALFITNALGFAGDLDKIRKLCDENDIILIEDNCEALGTELPSGKTGSFGIASSFSFFVAHHMSTIEGGMVCTDDNDIYEMLRIVRANGWDRNLNSSQQAKWRKQYGVKSELQAKYTFYDLAYNFRPTEITGFLGVTQLKYLKENIDLREKYYLILEEKVALNSDLIVLNREHLSKLSPFAFPVICKTQRLKEKYLDQFSGAGIEVRPMIAGNITHQPFFRKYVKQKYSLPNTDFIHKCGFYCGLYPELTPSDLEVLSSCLQKYDK